MELIEQKLNELTTEARGAMAGFKEAIAKQNEEIKNIGVVSAETKALLEAKGARLDKIQTQLDAISAASQERLVQTQEEKTLGDLYLESEEFKAAKEHNFRHRKSITVPFKRGAFPTEAKATISNSGLGAGTAGIAMPVSLVGTPLMIAQQELRIRNIMRSRALTTGNTYYWMKQSTRTNAASPQIEAAAKAESTYAWDTASDDVKTIAHFANVTRQALDDLPWMRRTIDSELLYGLLLKEEEEILAGSGAGEHLNGLITQATAYDTGLNQSGDTKLDKLRHAKLQARLAGLATYAPSAIVVHPTDMHTIELIKDQASNVGNYVVGDPKIGTAIKMVWGLPVVESDSISAGTFLVGAFSTAAELIDRMEATIDISFEHANNFTENKATILAEERIGLAVMRPTAFIYGSY
jgi:HK97 family phage major capsid protein